MIDPLPEFARRLGIYSGAIRFVHTYSHDGRVAEPEHDLSVLAEAPTVMKQIMRLIQFEDQKHYEQMTTLVGFDALADSGDVA